MSSSTFYPTKKQKMEWGWLVALAFLLCMAMLLSIGASMLGLGFEETGRHVRKPALELDKSHSQATLLLLFGAGAFASGLYLFRYVVTGYRVEMSRGALTVISPKHRDLEIAIKDIQVIGGKGPDDERIRLLSRGRYLDIPNFRTTDGKSLYEVLRKVHDPKETYFCTDLEQEVVGGDVDCVAAVYANRRKYDRFIIPGVIVYLVAACLSLPVEEALQPTWLVVVYFVYREFFLAEFVVEGDDLFFIQGRKAVRYKARDIMHVRVATGNGGSSTYVHLANGETHRVRGKKEDLIRPLIYAGAAARQ